MPCEFVNPLLDPRWNREVCEYRGATFFHTAEWARVLAEAYNYIPQYAVLKDSVQILGILPLMEVRSVWTGRRGVCLPFSDECAPLLSEGVTLSDIVEPAGKYGRESGWRYLELRGGAEAMSNAVESDAFAVHHLALEASEDLQFAKLRDSTRRNVQKSVREGVEVEHLRSSEAMEVYYALHCRTRRRLGVPPQPARFFKSIHRIVIEPGHGFVSLARFQKQWIAGAVFFRFGTHAMYKFGASDRKFQHLRPNNLVMWKAIDQLRKEGVREFSLGRTDLTDEGLLQFKRGWGGTESRLAYHRIGLSRELRPAPAAHGRSRAELPRRLVRYMPLSLLRFLGNLAYRHMA